MNARSPARRGAAPLLALAAVVLGASGCYTYVSATCLGERTEGDLRYLGSAYVDKEELLTTVSPAGAARIRRAIALDRAATATHWALIAANLATLLAPLALTPATPLGATEFKVMVGVSLALSALGLVNVFAIEPATRRNVRAVADAVVAAELPACALGGIPLR